MLSTEEDKSKVAGYASVDRDTRSLSYLQHPEPSGSYSQDFSLPIQDMMNPVVFWDNRDVWTYAVKVWVVLHIQKARNAASPARVLT